MLIVAADRNSAAHRWRVRWPVFLVAALGLIGLASPGSEAVSQAIGAQGGVEDAKKKTAGTGERAPPSGRVYTWRDGDRTRRAFLQSDLVVRKDTARAGPGVVVRVADAGEAEGQPVFRSSSGALMTLPGGVLLVFDRDWRKVETNAFFVSRSIAKGRVSPARRRSERLRRRDGTRFRRAGACELACRRGRRGAVQPQLVAGAHDQVKAGG